MGGGTPAVGETGGQGGAVANRREIIGGNRDLHSRGRGRGLTRLGVTRHRQVVG